MSRRDVERDGHLQGGNEPTAPPTYGHGNPPARKEQAGATEMTTLDTLEPLRSESTAGVIAGRIREAIMAGRLSPGSQLGEAEVAARLQVSRGPVREALQRLVQEGILTAVRNRGVFVPELDADDVVDIYLARQAVETTAAMVLIRRGATGLGAVERVLCRMDSAAKGARWSAVADIDAEFHQELVKATGSLRLVRMLGTLIVEGRLCMSALEGAYQASVDLVEEHHQLLDAIRQCDEDAAVQRTADHMQDAARRLRQLFSARAAMLDAVDADWRDPSARLAMSRGASRRNRAPRRS